MAVNTDLVTLSLYDERRLKRKTERRRGSEAENASEELANNFANNGGDRMDGFGIGNLEKRIEDKMGNWINDNKDTLTLLGGILALCAGVIGGATLYNMKDDILKSIKQSFKSNKTSVRNNETGRRSKLNIGSNLKTRINKSGARSNKKIIKDELAKAELEGYNISNYKIHDNGDLVITKTYGAISIEELYQNGCISKGIVKDDTFASNTWRYNTIEKVYDKKGNVLNKLYYRRDKTKLRQTCEFIYNTDGKLIQKIFKDADGNVITTFDDVVYDNNNRILKMIKKDLNGNKLGELEYRYSGSNAEIPKEVVFTSAGNKCLLELDKYGNIKNYTYNNIQLDVHKTQSQNYEDLIMDIETKSLKNMSKNDVTPMIQYESTSELTFTIKRPRHEVFVNAAANAISVKPYLYCLTTQRPVTNISIYYDRVFTGYPRGREEGFNVALDGIIPESKVRKIQNYLYQRKLDDVLGDAKSLNEIVGFESEQKVLSKLQEIVYNYIKTME